MGKALSAAGNEITFWCLWQHILGQPFIILDVGTSHVDHKLSTLSVEGYHCPPTVPCPCPITLIAL